MQRKETGTYRTSTVGGEVVRSFIPNALPPNPALSISAELERKVERAVLAVGRLDGVAALLPDTGLFIYAYVRREALLSSQIEGTQSSFSDLLLFEADSTPGVPFDDVAEVSNYVKAMTHGIERLQSNFPLSNRLLQEIHEILMQGARGAEKNPGEFRKSQNWIGGTRPGNAHLVPPPANEVPRCMAELEVFLHREDVPTLIKAALAHVQFETIHPFLDGNGRTGRLLIALILHNEHVLQQPLLYLSLFLKSHRDEYYRLLDVVRTNGDWEAWITFFVEGADQTATAAVETAHRLLALFKKDESQIQVSKQKVSSAIRTFALFRERPIQSIQTVCTSSGMAFPTATKAVEVLIALGIVKEVTGNKRNRLFMYSAYIDILSEGAQPIP